MTTEFIAQGIGIVAMVLNIFSYQLKNQKSIIAVQFFGSVLFCINFLMLGALTGGIMNIVALGRALAFYNKDKMGNGKKYWIAGFLVVYLAVYVCTFAVFDKEITVFNLITEFLPVIGMAAMTFGFAMDGGKYTRRLGLLNSPMWLIYNIVNFAIGGIIAEAFSLVSIIIATIRYDIKGIK